MKTQEKIRKLERDIATLWQIVEDERLWHPSVIREIQNRSRAAKLAYRPKKMKTADEIFTK